MDRNLSDLAKSKLFIGIEHEKAQNWREAAEAYVSALLEAPLDASIWYLVGACKRRAGQNTDAIQYLEKANMLEPNSIEYSLELGDAHFDLRQFDQAIKAYLKASDLDPDNTSAANNIGISLQEAGLLEEAINALKHALDMSPDDPIIKTNLAAAYLKTGCIEEALKQLESALKFDPRQSETWSNYGVALQDNLRIEEALTAHRRAIDLAPENHAFRYNFSMTLLLNGQFKEGFREFEHRLHMPDRLPREFEIPLWKGEDLCGQTILVHAEQGVGDAIQFCRFLPLLLRNGAGKIVFASHTSISQIMNSIEGVDQVLTDAIDESAFDWQLPLLSLPHRLDPELTYLSDSCKGYLNVPAFARSALPPPSGRLRVGLVWAGNPKHANDHNRSCKLNELAHLLEIPEIEWISLQVGHPAKQISNFRNRIVDLSEKLTDFNITAATIVELDLIITVDTSIVHLSGALGVPTWCLLPYAPDWRWLLGRDDTPWYSSVRLFRQDTPRDWTNLSRRVTAELYEHLGEPE